MTSIIKPNSITVCINNKVLTANSSHPNFSKIRSKVKENDETGLAALFEIKIAVQEAFSGSKVSIRGNAVFYGERRINNDFTARIISMLAEGFNVEPMLRFFENLQLNPSNRSVEMLFKFLETNDLPITDDGFFLAWKVVGGDSWSKYAGPEPLVHGKKNELGNVYYGIGEYIEMQRNLINENPEVLCHTGLHVCSKNYIQGFASSGDKTLLVKVNPKDVVSVPMDVNGTKMRVCAVTVLSEENSATPQNKTPELATSVFKMQTKVYRDENGRFTRNPNA